MCIWIGMPIAARFFPVDQQWFKWSRNFFGYTPHKYEFLVHIANSPKKPRRWTVSFTSLDELKQKIAEEFQIQGPFVVSYFDEDFSEYVEVDLRYLPKQAKLLIEETVLKC